MYKLSMGSNPSSPSRAVVAPLRDAGHRRVAALLDAAAQVIEERGFEPATMSEIAARADARIGSLYRFFPNKDAVADALVERYAALLASEFAVIQAFAADAAPEALADILSDLLVTLRPRTRALVALLDARGDWTEIRRRFRRETMAGVKAALLACDPGLGDAVAADAAAVLLNTMKAMAGMVLGDAPTAPGAPDELRMMNRLYLRSRLAPPGRRERQD